MACILVIDENDELRVVMREILEGAGYEVREASNGHEGLACYQAHLPAQGLITDS